MCNIIPTAMGWQNMQLHLMIKMLLLKPSKIFYTFVKLTLRPETTQNERPKACWSHLPVSLCKDGSSTFVILGASFPCNVILVTRAIACGYVVIGVNEETSCMTVSDSLVRFNLSLTQIQIVDSLPMVIMITGLSD